MKTSVELDDEKVALAKKLSPSTTLKDLLDKALDAYISRSRRHAVADMLGSDFFEDSKVTPKKKLNGRSHR